MSRRSNSKSTRLPASHPAEQYPEYRQFLIRSLEHNDTDMAAVVDLNRSLHDAKKAITEHCGESVLLALGKGSLALSREGDTLEVQQQREGAGGGDDDDIDENDDDDKKNELMPDDDRGRELCVDFLLRMRLRRRLLNRLARRLTRVAHAMDGDDVSPPAPPKYGDLRLNIDPESVQAYAKHWKRQDEARIRIEAKREGHIDTEEEEEKELDEMKKEKEPETEKDSEVPPTETKSSPDESSSPTKTDSEPEDKKDVDKENDAAAPDQTASTDPMEEEKVDEKKDSIDYEAFRDHKQGYEKIIDKATGAVTYTIIKQEDEPDEDKYGGGIGATQRYMGPKERESEYKRWRAVLLSRIPEQTTFEELGMENRVFSLEAREKIALKADGKSCNKKKTKIDKKANDDSRKQNKTKMEDDDDSKEAADDDNSSTATKENESESDETDGSADEDDKGKDLEAEEMSSDKAGKEIEEKDDDEPDDTISTDDGKHEKSDEGAREEKENEPAEETKGVETAASSEGEGGGDNDKQIDVDEEMITPEEGDDRSNDIKEMEVVEEKAGKDDTNETKQNEAQDDKEEVEKQVAKSQIDAEDKEEKMEIDDGFEEEKDKSSVGDDEKPEKEKDEIQNAGNSEKEKEVQAEADAKEKDGKDEPKSPGKPSNKKEEAGKKDNENGQEEETETQKRKRPISLAPTPSFYEQDLKRIKLIHSELIGASLQDHARRRLEAVTNEYNKALRISNDLFEHRQRTQNQLNAILYEMRNLQNSFGKRNNDYNVDFAIAKGRWNQRRQQFEKQKLEKMLPSRWGRVPQGTPLTMQVATRCDPSRTDPITSPVAVCLSDVIDAVDMVARGELRLEKFTEPFIPPPNPNSIDPSTGETQLQMRQRTEAILRKDMNNLTMKLRQSEEGRQRAWKRMLKTKAEFDIPHHQPLSNSYSYNRGRGVNLNLNNYHVMPLPALRGSTKEILPQNVAPNYSFQSYTPARRQAFGAQGVATSDSKYSAARVRKRISEDGSVAPVTAPKKTKDGLFQRPAGRTRKGMEWDAVRGIWVPARPSFGGY